MGEGSSTRKWETEPRLRDIQSGYKIVICFWRKKRWALPPFTCLFELRVTLYNIFPQMPARMFVFTPKHRGDRRNVIPPNRAPSRDGPGSENRQESTWWVARAGDRRTSLTTEASLCGSAAADSLPSEVTPWGPQNAQPKQTNNQDEVPQMRRISQTRASQTLGF